MMRKRRFAYGAWLLFVILLYFFENNTGTRTILAASVFLPAASILCAVRSARRVTVHLSAPDCCKQGDAAECSVRAEGLLPGAVLTAALRGRSRLTGEETAVKLSASRFAPDAAGTLRTAHCCMVILSLSDAAVQDWFGLYRCALTVRSTRFVTVEPLLFDMQISLAENETVTADSERWSSNHPGHDPSETFGFRTYVPGDPIRQIHWKLSGKLDDIMIREKSFPVDDTVLILAEAFQADRDPQRAETVAEVFSAVLQSFMEKKISCQAGVYDHSTGKFRLEKIRTEEDRENILYRFLRYGSDAKTPVTVREYLKDPGIQNFANYVYITGDPQDKEAELLAAKGEVTIVGCGTGGRDSGGEQVLWKYGSQNPKDSQKQHMENNCPVSCWKLH